MEILKSILNKMKAFSIFKFLSLLFLTTNSFNVCFSKCQNLKSLKFEKEEYPSIIKPTIDKIKKMFAENSTGQDLVDGFLIGGNYYNNLPILKVCRNPLVLTFFKVVDLITLLNREEKTIMEIMHAINNLSDKFFKLIFACNFGELGTELSKAFNYVKERITNKDYFNDLIKNLKSNFFIFINDIYEITKDYRDRDLGSLGKKISLFIRILFMV